MVAGLRQINEHCKEVVGSTHFQERWDGQVATTPSINHYSRSSHPHSLYQRSRIAMTGVVAGLEREKEIGMLERSWDLSGLKDLALILCTDLHSRLQKCEA